MIKSQSTFDLLTIVHTYLYPKQASGKPVNRSHDNTEPRKIFLPPYLYSSLESLRYELADHDKLHDVNISQILSAILTLGFDRIFENTFMAECLSELIALRREIFKRNDGRPKNQQTVLEQLARFDLKSLPCTSLTGSQMIQPRLPRYVLSSLSTKAHAIGTIHGQVSHLIILMLCKILSYDASVREDYRQEMLKTITTIEEFLSDKLSILHRLIRG